MENDLKITITLMVLVSIIGGVALVLSVEIVTGLMALIAVIISLGSLYFSRRITESEVGIIQDDIEGDFLCNYKYINEYTSVDGVKHFRNRYFKGGSLRFSLTFYNKGDRMSVVKVKSITIPQINPIKQLLKDNFSIHPHSHYLLRPNDIYFESNDSDEEMMGYLPSEPSKIDLLIVEYSWTHMEKTVKERKSFSLNCRIITDDDTSVRKAIVTVATE